MTDFNGTLAALAADGGLLQSTVATIIWTLCWLPLGLGLIKKLGPLAQRILTTKHPQPAQRTNWISSYGLSALFFWVPLPGLNFSLLHYAQGLMYTPSTALLLGCLCLLQDQWSQLNQAAQPRQRNQHRAIPWKRTDIWWVLTPLAIAFYPSALGVGLWDPYRLGYQTTFCLVIAAVNLVLWKLVIKTDWGQSLAIWLTVSLAAHALNLYESPNLWDILFDPFAALWAIGWSIKYFAQTQYQRMSQPTG